MYWSAKRFDAVQEAQFWTNGSNRTNLNSLKNWETRYAQGHPRSSLLCIIYPQPTKSIQYIIQIRQTCNVAIYAKKFGMNLTHRQLVNLTAWFHSQAALDNADNSANALVLAYPEREHKSLADKPHMVNIFLMKGMLDKATIYAMESWSNTVEAKGPIQPKFFKVCLRTSSAFGGGILLKA